MAGMTGFSLGGFGFPEARLGMGAYSREHRATILRQFATDKYALWGGGVRVPIGNRISHAAASLTWGTLTPEKSSDDAIALVDFAPFSYEAYEYCARTVRNLKCAETSSNN